MPDETCIVACDKCRTKYRVDLQYNLLAPCPQCGDSARKRVVRRCEPPLWFRTSEELPPAGKPVLLFAATENERRPRMEVGYLERIQIVPERDDAVCSWGPEGFYLEAFSHWAPLPLPPDTSQNSQKTVRT